MLGVAQSGKAGSAADHAGESSLLLGWPLYTDVAPEPKYTGTIPP